MSTNYMMSSAQKRLYTITQMEPDSITYNVPMLLKSKRKIKIEKLENALEELCKVHDIFRTSFIHVKDMFIQTIADVDSKIKVEVEFEKIDHFAVPIVFQHFVRPFALEKPPLMRVKVAETEEGETILMMDIHHIIFDGGSINRLFDDLSKLYHHEPLTRQAVQYKDYAAWHNKMKFEKAEKYWLEEFSDSIPDLNLHSDYMRPQQQSFKGETISVHLEQNLKERITLICRKTGTTEYIVLLTVFMIFLYKYTKSREIVVGTPISGRTRSDVQDMIGMFVNTLAIRGTIDPEAGFYTVLEQIKEKCLQAFEHQEYPFEQLVEHVVSERDPSRSPIFDVMFALQNNDNAPLKLGEAVFTEIKFENLVAKFDLTVTIESSSKDYWVDWEYCTDLFKRESVERMGKHFKVLLENTIDSLGTRIRDISLCSRQEQEMILNEFNQTARSYPENSSVVELFEEMAEKYPFKDAVITADMSITYSKLNQRANQLARTLRGKGVKPDEFVGIIAERKIDTIIGILGILKAGGAYMPIDPKYPLKRIAYMIKDSNSSILLTANKKLGETLASLTDIVYLEEASSYIGSGENLEIVNSAKDLVYLIYTSGTTGEPKGVMIEHKSVNRLVRNTNYADFTDIRILQTGSMTFDASTFEIWGALLNGGSVYIAKEDVLSSVEALKNTIRINKINTLFITTALFNQFISLDNSVFDSLEQLLFGGEATSEEHVRILLNHNEKIRFYNVYGPTETTTFALYYPIRKAENELKNKTPIGKPISNTQVYILNEDGLCAVGVPGELYIGGPGVARGYLNREDITKEKFIENPYKKNDLIYRTGDIVRWLEDGNIEYLGRIDDQVKLRGFRIELGEIEKCFRDIEGIRDARVIVGERNGDKYLCGYITGVNELTIPAIKDKLKDVLPDYMIPAYIMKIEKFPINKNGKLDKKALPKIEAVGSSEYAEPENETELSILEVFKEILGVGQIGTRDSFFELGGDSIKAIRMVSKLRDLGYEIRVRTIMSLKTVKNISQAINQSDTLSVKQEEITGRVGLTPIQEKFFKFNLADPHHFNQSFLLECRERINKDSIEKAIQAIVSHHDILRATYQDRAQVILKYSDKRSYELKYVDLMQMESEDTLYKKINDGCDILQRTMNLSTGPLFKAALFQTSQKDFLFLCIHHLVIDGVSWRIILEDLNIGYMAASKNREIVLPKKTVSFQKWSDELRAYSTSDSLNRELDFWLEVETKLKKSSMNFDHIRNNNLTESVAITLSEDYTRSLLYKCNRAYHTEINDILLTALFRAMHTITGNDTISVNMEGHGRETIGKALMIDRTVGWFTNIYPFAVNHIGHSIEEDILNVMGSFRKIPNYGMGYSILKELAGKLTELDPLITFNYLGEFGQEQDNSNFVISDAAHGLDISPRNKYGTLVSVNGWILNKTLQLSVTYHTDYDMGDFINDLHTQFRLELLKVIEHCISKRLDLLELDLTKIDPDTTTLVQYVWLKFRVDSILKEVNVNYKRYHLLFVSDLTKELRRNIVNVMVRDSFVDLIPDYIVDSKYIDQCSSLNDKASMITMCCDSSLSFDLNAVGEAITAYNGYLAYDVVDHFISPPMQKSFLQLDPPLIVNEKICINGVYSKDIIINAVRKIIKHTDSLRMSYEKENENFLIYEHAFDENWYIPYYDLVNASLKYTNKVNEAMTEKSSWHYANGQKNRLSMIAVTKENEKEHVIHIIASHGVWDKMSSQIFEESILKILNADQDFEKAFDSNTYKDYVAEINRNSSGDINLPEYIDSIHLFIERNVSNRVLKSQSSILKLGGKALKFFQEKPWDFIVYLFKGWSKANGLTSESSFHIPAFILQEDRRYMEKDYTNSMGAYLDFLPMTVNVNVHSPYTDTQARIEKLQNIKKENHVNFLNIISDKTPYFLMNEMIFINYHGIFEMTYESLQRNLSILESQSASSIISREIYINSYSNYLSIFYPVFQNCHVNIEQVLKDKCNELEKML